MKDLKNFIIPALLLIISVFLQSGTIIHDIVPEEIYGLIKKSGEILFIISIAWGVIAFIRVSKIRLLQRYDISKTDNLKTRKLYTQYNILERIIIVIIVLISISIILMLFDGVKNIGLSLFASAGIAGLIIGLAAQKVLGSVLAGLQIAIAQPIRIDDVVIVENEWGWIEEINLTYVVIRIWDKRRLIVPSTYFLERPFQNWTRTSADILGSVFIYTDYTMPVDAIREELTKILKSCPFWDKNVNVLQVTDAKENTLEIRALMSASTSPEAWNLRVHVREKLVKFIQEKYPQSLPKTRVVMES